MGKTIAPNRRHNITQAKNKQSLCPNRTRIQFQSKAMRREVFGWRT